VNFGSRALAAGLASVGVCVAAYLTLVHYAQGQIPLACSSSGLVDCERVTSSAQSSVGPVPVALLGVVWFAVMLALVAADRGGRQTVLVAELGWTAIGLAVVLYLVFAELFLIGALCAWCSVLHAVIVALFLQAVFRASGASVESHHGVRPQADTQSA
jgi:uncharacterized membrane protein